MKYLSNLWILCDSVIIENDKQCLSKNSRISNFAICVIISNTGKRFILCLSLYSIEGIL